MMELEPKPVDITLALWSAWRHYGHIKPKHPAAAFKVAAAQWKEVLHILRRLLFLVKRGRELPSNYGKYMKYIPFSCDRCPAGELSPCPIQEHTGSQTCFRGVHLLWLHMRSQALENGLEEAENIPALFEEAAKGMS